MGLFNNGPYDLDNDGYEDAMETFAGMQLFAGSRQEALDLTGDDTFYIGDDLHTDFEDDDNGFHDEFDDIDDFDDADEYDDVNPDDHDDWD